MRATITKALLNGLAAPADGKAKLRVFDDRTAGFIAERRSTGTTFYVRYVDARRRTKEVKLGRLGQITLDQARKAAEKIRSQVSLGSDPVAERERLRAVPTVEAFVRDRYLPHAKENLRSWDCVERYLRLRIIPAIGRKAMDEVTQNDVETLRRQMIDAGLAAGTTNRHLACLRALFNAAIRWRVYEGRNPASSPGLLRETARDRYLSPEQTRALIAALDRAHCQDAATALVLLAATGARKQEILRSTWEMVDLERGALLVPLSKNGRPRLVPLSRFAVAVLRKQLSSKSTDSPYVFPSGLAEGKALANVRRTWARAKREAGLPADLRVHDLRHSFATTLANKGVELFEIGRVLGHAHLASTTRYAHHSPARLVATASVAAEAWSLTPEPADA